MVNNRLQSHTPSAGCPPTPVKLARKKALSNFCAMWMNTSRIFKRSAKVVAEKALFSSVRDVSAFGGVC